MVTVLLPYLGSASTGRTGVSLLLDISPSTPWVSWSRICKDNARGLKNLLDNLGLEVSAAHANFNVYEDGVFEQTVAYYKVLGADTLIIPWDERAWSSNEVDNFIKDLNRLYTKLAAEGFRFGFHNHDQEFNTHNGSTFWTTLPNQPLMILFCKWMSVG